MLKGKFLCIIKIPLLLLQAKNILQKKKTHSEDLKKLYVLKCKKKEKEGKLCLPSNCLISRRFYSHETSYRGKFKKNEKMKL